MSFIKTQTVLLFFLMLTVTLISSKKVHKKIFLDELSSNTQTVFLAKFGVSTVGTNVTVKFKYNLSNKLENSVKNCQLRSISK